MVRPAQRHGADAPAKLLDAQVRAGSPRSKRGFAALLEGTLRVAREHGLIGASIASAAIDSTGYEAGHTSAYFARRSECVKSTFPKLATICDIRSYLILAASAGQGPYPDDPHFAPLASRAFDRVRFGYLLADAGYDSEASHRLVRDELGARSVIPPLRGRQTHKPPTGRYRRLMKSRFPRKRYGQRWQIEATYSQDKRRFGSQIAASS
ncbi:MAG: transposase, partial [Phycisphaerales bacterium]|nr:transposase [Phycisphaerales bacterium]